MGLNLTFVILLHFMFVLCKLIAILLSIAFLTLFERKLLGYRQIRVGPNKVILVGLLQPVLDAIKLITKENITLLFNSRVLFLLGPILSFLLMLVIYFSSPLHTHSVLIQKFSILFMLIVIRVNVYGVLLTG